jgi:hypothetical protein
MYNFENTVSEELFLYVVLQEYNELSTGKLLTASN